jgi:CheY-like chemotaxis protein
MVIRRLLFIIHHWSLGAFVGKKILVADDSPTIRKVVESLLKKEGYEVLCAEDGASALGMAKAKKPALIFWDDSLPILDGHGVCEKLKDSDELKDTPVIILLAKDQVKKERELVRAGADAFMVKPFNPKDILEKVQKFLNKKNINCKAELREEPKHKFGHAEKESGLEKTDESLDILETSDFVESFEAPPSSSEPKDSHGFDWFTSELKKEMEETKQVDLGEEKDVKQEIISTEITSFDREDSKKKDEDKKEVKTCKTDENKRVYQDIEKSLDQKIPYLNYDKMIRDLIETISTKIAQEVAKKIEPRILKQIVRDEVEKLRKDGIKAN